MTPQECETCQLVARLTELVNNSSTLIEEQKKVIDQLTACKVLIDMIKQGNYVLS